MKTEIKTLYHANGQLMYEWPMLNVGYHGIMKGWHDNGNIQYIWPCLNGQAQGICQDWHYDGTRILIRQCKNNNRHGPFIRINTHKKNTQGANLRV